MKISQLLTTTTPEKNITRNTAELYYDGESVEQRIKKILERPDVPPDAKNLLVMIHKQENYMTLKQRRDDGELKKKLMRITKITVANIDAFEKLKKKHQWLQSEYKKLKEMKDPNTLQEQMAYLKCRNEYLEEHVKSMHSISSRVYNSHDFTKRWREEDEKRTASKKSKKNHEVIEL